MLHNPQWLIDKAGFRERAIMNANDAVISQFVEPPETTNLERFSKKSGILTIYSKSEGWFLINWKTQEIVG